MRSCTFSKLNRLAVRVSVRQTPSKPRTEARSLHAKTFPRHGWGARLGIQDDFDAAVLLIAELLIQFRRFGERTFMRDHK